jgi:hypothetical protein
VTALLLFCKSTALVPLAFPVVLPTKAPVPLGAIIKTPLVLVALRVLPSNCKLSTLNRVPASVKVRLLLPEATLLAFLYTT